MVLPCYLRIVEQVFCNGSITVKHIRILTRLVKTHHGHPLGVSTNCHDAASASEKRILKLSGWMCHSFSTSPVAELESGEETSPLAALMISSLLRPFGSKVVKSIDG